MIFKILLTISFALPSGWAEHAQGKNLADTILSCSPGTEGADDCFRRTLLLKDSCLIDKDYIACDDEASVRSLFNETILASNCKTSFYALPSEGIFTISLHVPKGKPTETCSYQGFDIRAGETQTAGIAIDNATLGKDRKWSAPPPVIPIGLRSIFNPKNIVVTLIQGRYQFGMGYGKVDYYRPAGPLLGDSYELKTTSDVGAKGTSLEDKRIILEKVGVRVVDPTKVRIVNRIAETYGLDKQGYFLRADRHVIGKSKDFNYSVVSVFKPKNDTRICGHLVPKGTNLILSTIGPELSIENVIAEGALYVLGIPNTKKLKYENEPPSRTLSCVPKAALASKYEDIVEPLHINPNAKLPPLPKVDYNDCECIAKELQVRD